jgi:hypothetical protein
VPEGTVGSLAQKACPVNGCAVDTSSLDTSTIGCGCGDPSADCGDPGDACHYYTCYNCGCRLHSIPTLTYYADADGDNYGDLGRPVASCGQPTGYVTDSTDCNDGNASIHPGAPEVCDGVDQDCNGTADDGVATQTYYRDADGDGYGATASGTRDFCSQTVAAAAGYVPSNTDCNDAAGAVHPGATEVCNGVDDDCSGTADNGLTMQTYYRDLDGDGYGRSASGTKMACSLAVAGAGYVADNTDCDDGNKDIHPGAPEICANGKDDNCNGTVDTDAPMNSTFYRDMDADGYGAAAGGTVLACAPPMGYVSSNTDCDDANPAIHPGATEVCNNIDDNCDMSADNGLTTSTFFLDRDGDGFGSAMSGTKTACGAAVAGPGYVAAGGDCNDNDKNVYPGATEICNGVDDDCNGTPDNGLTMTTYYRDADGDGYGNDASAKTVCSIALAGSGYVNVKGDCDDTDPDINPGAAERCENHKDDNCNGVVDTDATMSNVFYRDGDGDGYGAGAGETFAACIPPIGYVSSKNDCNDADPTVHPGRNDICNGKDDNCVGGIDEDGVCGDAGPLGDGGPMADVSQDGLVPGDGGGTGGRGGADGSASTDAGGSSAGGAGNTGTSGSGGDQGSETFKRDIACACRVGGSSTGVGPVFGSLFAAVAWALRSARRRRQNASESVHVDG